MSREHQMEAVGIIYDHAVEAGDQRKIKRIAETYDKDFLDTALGGYPDYLDDKANDENIGE